jgi:hypothetical protein
MIMIKLSIALAVGCAILLAVASTGRSAQKAENPGLGKIRHIVLLKFKDGASREQVKAVEDAFAGLQAKIPQIRDFEWGTDISPEGLQQGFTHCFLVTFDDEKARDEYLPHPAHKAFVEVLKPVLDKVLVVDYKARR